MDRTFDAVALGELLMDFNQSGQSPQGNPLYEANPGGAPANVLARLGRSCRSATVAAARETGALISFDPNLREPLWADLADAKAQIAWGLGQCDILKIADNELLFMTGEEDFDRGAAALASGNVDLVFWTNGMDERDPGGRQTGEEHAEWLNISKMPTRSDLR